MTVERKDDIAASRNKRAVSIEDIAREAGVSHSTVSRALRDSNLISAPVKERIQVIAKEKGYVPNALAQSLHKSVTKTIGLVIRSIADPFYGGLVKGVEEVANEEGFSLILSASHGKAKQETGVIQEFHRRRVDGLLIADSQLTQPLPDIISLWDVPTVLINRQVTGPVGRLRTVGVNDTLGLQLAMEHLLSLGHRKIGYLGVENRPRSNQERLSGYRKTLALQGLKPPAEWEVIIPATYLDNQNEEALAGEEFGLKLLKTGVTAICCYNDMLAVGMILACRKEGLNVPSDISVVGYDNVAFARYITPSLTTIHQPVDEMGRKAVQILMTMMREQDAEDQILNPSLVIRESTALPTITFST